MSYYNFKFGHYRFVTFTFAEIYVLLLAFFLSPTPRKGNGTITRNRKDSLQYKQQLLSNMSVPNHSLSALENAFPLTT